MGGDTLVTGDGASRRGTLRSRARRSAAGRASRYVAHPPIAKAASGRGIAHAEPAAELPAVADLDERADRSGPTRGERSGRRFSAAVTRRCAPTSPHRVDSRGSTGTPFVEFPRTHANSARRRRSARRPEATASPASSRSAASGPPGAATQRASLAVGTMRRPSPRRDAAAAAPPPATSTTAQDSHDIARTTTSRSELALSRPGPEVTRVDETRSPDRKRRPRDAVEPRKMLVDVLREDLG